MEAFISQTKVSYEFPSEIVYEHKFDTAIRDTFLDRFEERYINDRLSLKDIILLSNIPSNLRHNKWRKDGVYMALLVKRALNNHTKLPNESRDRIINNRIVTIIQDVLKIQFGNMFKNYHVSNRRILVHKYTEYVDQVSSKKEIRILSNFATWLSVLLDKVTILKRKQNKLTDEKYKEMLEQNMNFNYDTLNTTILLGDNIIVIIIDNEIWVAPQVCLLQIHNKICDIMSVLIYALASQGASLPDDSYTQTVNFITELANLLKKYNFKYYDISRTLEALCIAESIIIHEEWKNIEYLRVLSYDLFLSTNFDYMGSTLRSLLIEANTPLRHQLCCLGKILGHPYVQMESGAKALFDKTNEVYTLNHKSINDCIGHIKINYIRNHIQKYRKWPPCNITYGGPISLTQSFVRNRDPYDPYIIKLYGRMPIEAMDFVELLPNGRFKNVENIIPYLKDKTITVLRSKVLKLILDNEENTRSNWEDTRLILAYLLNPSLVHNHAGYIENYESESDIEEFLDYLVIRIVPKEGELKTIFRGFGCKTYEDRMRCLAQEMTAMSYLDEYSDEQAMTLSELEILKRLSAFRNLNKAYPGYKILYINLDASAWNNHFREDTVDDVLATTLDPIYDTNIFKKTHKAYRWTLIYVPNGPTTYFWTGQAGGIEGLNQDTWVIVYLGQIKAAMEGVNAKYHVLCKGDDVRLVIAVPPSSWKHREMVDIKNDIVGRLAKALSDFGHKIKIQESYGSSKYLAFSKCASISSIEMPQGYRKIQKCYGANNALIATMDEYIGSTFSNAHSACKVEPNVLPSYIVALYWSITYLLGHHTYEKLLNDHLVCLMLTPSIVNGFPIIYLHNMAVRAESDLLAPFLEIYKYCHQSFPMVAQYMENMMYAPIKGQHESLIMLYKDPYSIPHDRPILPTAELRKFIIPTLYRYVKNEDVKELLEATKDESMLIIHEILSSVNILNVKVLSALYSATAEGMLDELVRKFESARSINELFVKTLGKFKSVKILRRVVKKEHYLQKWRALRVRGKNNNKVFPYFQLVTNCPAESAHNIRKFLWGKEIVGITMPPLQHQLHIITAFTNTYSDWVNSNHFTYSISENETNLLDSDNDHYSIGKYKPFVGYTTRNGMTEPTLHMIERDPMLTKIKNLLDLITWTNISGYDDQGNDIISNCPDLIRIILGSFTNTPLSDLAPFSGVRRSGTIQHHVRSPSFRESIVPNVLSNAYTRVMGESNSHLRYRNSRQHFQTNFLHIMCYTTWAINWELEFSPRISTPNKIWVVTTDCNFCNIPITEQPIIFDQNKMKGVSLHQLSFSKIGSIAEGILKKSLDLASEREKNIDSRDMDEIPLEVACLGILQEIIEQSYFARKSVQVRYEVPVMTDTAYEILVNMVPQNRSRNVGQTEMKRIPINILLPFISSVISRFSGSLKRKTYLTTRDESLAMIPAEELPWYGLINQIHAAGKLPKLVQEFTRFLDTPQATCFYNPISASRYLCQYATTLHRALKTPQTVVVLSYYTDSQLTNALHHVLHSKIISIIRKEMKLYMPRSNLNVNELNEEDKQGYINFVSEIFVLMTCIACLPSICNDIANNILRDNLIEVKGIGVDLINENDIDEMFDGIDDSIYDIIEIVSKIHSIGINIDELRSDIIWEDVISHMIPTYEKYTFNVYYTNIGHCCLKVRSMSFDGESESDDGLFREQVPLPENPEVTKPLNFPKPFVSIEGNDYQEAMFVEKHDTIIFQPIISDVKFNNLFCIIGQCSGSESHMASMLKYLGFDITNTPIKLSCTCFADGFGGFSNSILSFCPESQILFHTLPEDTESDIIIPSIKDNELKGRVLTQHINEGYHDLSLSTSYSRLEQYGALFDLVTSDLEMNKNNLTLYNNVIYNIMSYYLKNRTRKCLFISKLRIDQPREIIKSIDVLSQFCVSIALHSPLSNDSSTYVYIVARGWRKSYSEYDVSLIWNGENGPYSIQMLNSYYKQVTVIRERFIRLLQQGLDIRQLNIALPLEPKYKLLMLYDRLPSLLQNEFMVPMFMFDDPLDTDNISWNQRKLNMLNPNIEESCDIKMGVNLTKLIQSDLLSLENKDYGDISSHRQVHICRIFKSTALKHFTDNIHDPFSPLILNIDHLQHIFSNLIRNLSPRDKFGLSNIRPWYDCDLILDNSVRICYNSSFQRGVYIGMVLYGTLSVTIKTDKSKLSKAILKTKE